MSLGELVFWYLMIVLVLLLAFVVLLLRRKAGGKPAFTQTDWRFLFGSPKEKVLTGEFWLKIFLATFIALSMGVIIAVFVLPYGSALAVGALVVTVVALVVLVPALLE
ncbi:MAG: hypothetical protein ACREQ7_21125 [Candidatus Binatia bacterium]